MDIKKEMFLLYVGKTIADHPEWYGDTVMAMQHGLSNALSIERSANSTLAAALGWMATKAKKQFGAQSKLPLMREAISLMIDKQYDGTQFGEELKKYLEEEKE